MRTYRGDALIDGAPVVAVLKDARAAGIAFHEIARAAGKSRTDIVHYASARRSLMMSSTASAVCDAVDYLLEQRAARLNTARRTLRKAHPQPTDDSSWPTAALFAYCERHNIAVTEMLEADRRHVYRVSEVSTVRADRICDALDVNPEAIWPTWWQ